MPKPGPDRQWERGGADPAVANVSMTVLASKGLTNRKELGVQ